ncbi:hypothetical protein E2C01_094292 [Portunus trituberculatus]|uniref:Uncharacterized protein n=1 Tax=Portunus trituberculatus TaxID=210409 RepID=A0A5B7JX75_PORTR|nr:hypothetical protein [Portunus trituberculatus]
MCCCTTLPCPQAPLPSPPPQPSDTRAVSPPAAQLTVTPTMKHPSSYSSSSSSYQPTARHLRHAMSPPRPCCTRHCCPFNPACLILTTHLTPSLSQAHFHPRHTSQAAAGQAARTLALPLIKEIPNDYKPNSRRIFNAAGTKGRPSQWRRRLGKHALLSLSEGGAAEVSCHWIRNASIATKGAAGTGRLQTL